jgi:pimeloyl-ACP methyl ester carboxylesterase
MTDNDDFGKHFPIDEHSEGTRWDQLEPGPGNMKLPRNRDNQQWILDYLVKVTGKDRHFFYDDRKFPAGTRSYAMIPHQMARAGRHKETLAREAEKRGHVQTAFRLFRGAALDYHYGQHALPYDDHPEKIFLYDKLLECFERVISLSPRPIEKLEIEWRGVSLPGLFYPASKSGAPTVLHINGMDSPKELFPDAIDNPYTSRDVNVFIIDGPGQGLSLMRKTRITPDNFADAMGCVVDYILGRDEVDSNLFGCVGYSMGTFWAMQLATRDSRIKALATGAGCYGPHYGIWQQSSPHFKRQFMFMSGITNEEEFDPIAEKYVLSDAELGNVKCPVLMLHGEFDPLSPLQHAYRVYQGLSGPKEFWVTEDDAHSPGGGGHLGGQRAFGTLIDWIRDALTGTVPPKEGQMKILKARSGKGPYSDPVSGLWLPDRFETL